MTLKVHHLRLNTADASFLAGIRSFARLDVAGFEVGERIPLDSRWVNQ